MHMPWYATALVTLALSIAATAHAQPPTAEDVGDADSFGRTQTYIGTVNLPSVFLQPDCANPDRTLPPDGRCVTLQPAPQATGFAEADLGAIRLPARATRSLICFSLTPFITVDFANETGTRQTRELSVFSTVTIENDVLNDPTLIDPATGQPYGGRMALLFGIVTERRTLEPGAEDGGTFRQGRNCVDGLINRRVLISQGLSEAKATEFFRRPMRLVFGTRGGVSMLRSGEVLYGMRLYGDR